MNELPQEAINEFLAETDEMIESIIINLGRIEKGDDSSEVIKAVYREMHTIKGSAQLFGFLQIGQISHAMETSLDPVRSNRITLISDHVDILFQGLDLVKKLTDSLRDTGQEIDCHGEITSVVSRLTEITANLLTSKKPEVIDTPYIPEDLPNSKTQKDAEQAAEATQKPLDKKVPGPSEISLSPQQKKVPTTTAKGPASNEGQDTMRQIPEDQESVNQGNGSQKPEPKSSETLRVQVDLLDNLMNLVGELVLIRNQVLQYDKGRTDPKMQVLSQSLNTITTQLQDEVMKTRMQPIGNILLKFQRVVRDLSRDLGKKINLKLEGVETELDKTLLEAIKGPLTHIVRNSADHGLETPEGRRQAGKSETGLIEIASYHDGGEVIVEISDDGKGLNREIIGEKAVEKGLISQSQFEQMTDRDVYNLIFSPGFSTAEKVSSVSGRGVGMDVVKTNIERIGGLVDISSNPGKGSVVRLKIPLTLAIIPALIIRSGEEIFAIPQAKLVELVRLDLSNDNDAVEDLNGKPVYRLRGRLLPLVYIHDILGIERKKDEDDLGENIVVLDADGEQFGIVVDCIEDSADIVVKPLSAFLKELTIYSGATITGDGKVALALDVLGICEHINITKGHGNEKAYNTDHLSISDYTSDRTEYVVIDIGLTAKYAIPLCYISRLEEVPRSKIEYSGNRKVIQYRDKLLPIIDIAESLDLKKEHANTDSDNISIVVIERNDKVYGLTADSILDILSVTHEIDPSISDRPGVLGSLIHNDNIIVVVDSINVIRKHDGEADLGNSKSITSQIANGRKVLVVDDQSFFRKRIGSALTNAGYEVMTAPNGKEAYAVLQEKRPDHFDAIVTDIEMPELDGMELAQKVRATESIKGLPIIAVSTKARPIDIKRGKEAGFTEHLEKLDPNKLLDRLNQIITRSKAA